MSGSTKSQLETLPNELFLEVFQYLAVEDLRSFKGLNKRINSIIDNVNININVKNSQETLDLLSIFSPLQVIRFDIQCPCANLDLNKMQNLRSLTINCFCLEDARLRQFLREFDLPLLKWLFFQTVIVHQTKIIMETVAIDERFSSISSLLLSIEFRDYQDVHFEISDKSFNTTLRYLAIDTCHPSNFNTLLRTFPNLSRFEANLMGSLTSINDNLASNLSLNHIRVTLADSLSNLEYLLKSAPNVKRLRIRGDITSNGLTEHFERMATLFIRLAPNLVKFDCELYCCLADQHGNDAIIRQIHPLFENVKYFPGPNDHRCYATDINTYPDGNEYQRIPQRPTNFSAIFHHDYDDDDDDDDDNDYDYDYDRSEDEYYEHRDMYWDAEADDWYPMP